MTFPEGGAVGPNALADAADALPIVLDTDPDAATGPDAAEADGQPAVGTWEDEWKDVLTENEKWGPALAQEDADRRVEALSKRPAGFFAFLGKAARRVATLGRAKEVLPAEEEALLDVTPEVIIVGLVRGKRSLRNLKSWIMPDFVEERVIAAGWILSRREYDDPDAAPEPATEDEAESPKQSVHAESLDEFGDEALAEQNDEDAEETDAASRNRRIEHIVVTSMGQTLRFVGASDAQKRKGEPYRYATVRTRRDLDTEKLQTEKDLLADHIKRNPERYIPTMRFAGKITLENFVTVDLGPEDDEISPSTIHDGLDLVLERVYPQATEAEPAEDADELDSL